MLGILLTYIVHDLRGGEMGTDTSVELVVLTSLFSDDVKRKIIEFAIGGIWKQHGDDRVSRTSLPGSVLSLDMVDKRLCIGAPGSSSFYCLGDQKKIIFNTPAFHFDNYERAQIDFPLLKQDVRMQRVVYVFREDDFFPNPDAIDFFFERLATRMRLSGVKSAHIGCIVVYNRKSPDELLKKIEKAILQGYKKTKGKVAPILQDRGTWYGFLTDKKHNQLDYSKILLIREGSAKVSKPKRYRKVANKGVTLLTFFSEQDRDKLLQFLYPTREVMTAPLTSKPMTLPEQAGIFETAKAAHSSAGDCLSALEAEFAVINEHWKKRIPEQMGPFFDRRDRAVREAVFEKNKQVMHQQSLSKRSRQASLLSYGSAATAGILTVSGVVYLRRVQKQRKKRKARD